MTAPLAVACSVAAVASGVLAVFGRIRPILRGRLPRCASDFRLIRLERVAYRGSHVALPGCPVAAFGRAVSGVGVQIGLIAVVTRRHKAGAYPPLPATKLERGAAGVRGRRFAQCREWADDGGMSSASWTVPASAASVSQVRQSVVDFACENGVPEPCASDVRLAVSEAVTNAVVHAFRGREESGTVIVTVYVRDRESIEVLVTDNGSGMAPRDDSPGIGLGLPLIRHLADRFDHRRPDGGGTELWMLFSFTASDSK